MRFPRAGGTLLHPTSLPGPHGAGDLGRSACRFVDFLAQSGQTLWQVLPLGPAGPGASPYASYSAFAGDPLLISLEQLKEDGLVGENDLEPLTRLPTAEVAFGDVVKLKDEALRVAFSNFECKGSEEQKRAFVEYCQNPAVTEWLEDFALFMALKHQQGQRPWTEWDSGLTQRDPVTISEATDTLSDEIWYQRFLQWQFELQWRTLVRYAHSKGIQVIGDLPIYVADDSADAWSHPELFHLDETGNRAVVAGVPPDYFSETGQLWGNPLYRWEMAERTQYVWWIARFRLLFSRVDRVRVDHFRGFEAYWEVPAGEKTAENGRWVKGPGHRLFHSLERAFGQLPIIAEDLGIITPEVVKLRDDFTFPGMKVLQFAFGGGPENDYLPHNYEKNSVVYTGTHDNDTTAGWLATENAQVVDTVRAYVGEDRGDLVRPLVRAAFASVADTCIIPLQDLLELGTEARMNVPGTTEGNWKWRCKDEDLSLELAEEVRELVTIYGRAPRRTASQT